MNNIAQHTKITHTDINTLISECNNKLSLSGGTMTGQINYTSGSNTGWICVSSNSGDCYICSSERTDTKKRISFGIGSSGQNRGIWDNSCSNWLIYRDSEDTLKSGGKKVVTSPYDDTIIRNITDFATRYEVLSVQSPNYTTAIMSVSEPTSETNNGKNVRIGGYANTVIGSGESTSNCFTDIIASSAEAMYVTSDGNIVFYVNCQTYANKKQFAFLSNGRIETPTGTLWIA